MSERYRPLRGIRPSWSLAVVVMMWALQAQVPSAQAASDAAEQAKNRIVMLEGKLEGEPTFGAGIILGTRGNRLYIATANHVVRHGDRTAEELKVRFKFFPGKSFTLEVLGRPDKSLDLAVLSVKGVVEQGKPFAVLSTGRVGEVTLLQRGDPVHAIGYPKEQAWFESGVQETFIGTTGNELEFDSEAVAIGTSGGALFNTNWELIGMVHADEPPRPRAIDLGRMLEKLGALGYPLDFATAASISGTWTGNVGDSPIRFEFKVLGDELFGTVTDKQDQAGILEGAIKGDRVTFSLLRWDWRRESSHQAFGPATSLTFRDSEYSVRTFYRGTVTRDEIEFIRQSERGDPPESFVVKRHAPDKRAWMGIEYKMVTPAQARAMGVKEAEGAVTIVAKVLDGGPAAKAGVEVDDLILSFDGAPLTSEQDFASMVANTPVGASVELQIVRRGKPQRLTVEIGETLEQE